MQLSGSKGISWLGIGAQKSGTTWFADLLTQHPAVCLNKTGQKELKFLDRLESYEAAESLKQYLQYFEGVNGAAGEWTPTYLWCPWVARLAYEAVGSGCVLLVLLRDPIDRFESAMRQVIRQRERKGETGSVRGAMMNASWAGMYASQLRPWVNTFGAEQLMVFQYEAVRENPQAFVDAVWARLGLTPCALDLSSRARNRELAWRVEDDLPGYREDLVELYRHEVEQLVEEWGLERRLWRNFA